MTGSFSMLVLGLAVSAMQAEAQPDPPRDEDEGMVCVGVARQWRGDLDSVRRIRADPVPAAYRALYFEGGCGSGLVRESLIDWHLGFGDEASTAAALAFLDEAYARGRPALAALPRAFAPAWRSARRAVAAAGPALAEPGPARDRLRRLLDRSPEIARLRALTQARDGLVFLATQHLRAAEFYGSAALLARATTYVETARAMAPPPDAAMPAAAGSFVDVDPDPYPMRDFDMRLALLKARLSRAPVDIDAASRLIDANFSPAMTDAADNYAQMEDFCDSSGDEALEAVRAACNEDGSFPRRAIRFWRYQAQLDMLMAADPVHYRLRAREQRPAGSVASYERSAVSAGAGDPESWAGYGNYDSAINLLEAAREQNRQGSGGYDDADGDLAALRLARADLLARLAETAQPGGGRRPDAEVADLLRAALAELARAVPLVPPAENPARFRQVASLYLALAGPYEAARARAQEAGAVRILDPGVARNAAFFRRVMPALEDIAAGAVPPG
jgi:hypothetical protein